MNISIGQKEKRNEIKPSYYLISVSIFDTFELIIENNTKIYFIIKKRNTKSS